ncbi:diguanylate cyclase (GGDEF) domain-containing protein [Oceanospirillum multiglobuliferum]|uniref:diguanylate cyclase n=1 Tax=Oceanospirillum multiglobuliferum TaxID=64969 RepID=A0A1T4KGE8_9GAMM|nr:GGDEF domain-containing protein [Oceanospirillum multiglobuliferum]OPX56026.1 hypothetical protein BTE48_05560 [Oceanospirillum multiglobuliferum]SJZ41490.1 diguanylate cyclase (GGDEF) domain-containing protein [Oceanospirillum multiglobuliferum]
MSNLSALKERHEQRLRIKRLMISVLSQGLILLLLATALVFNLLDNVSPTQYLFLMFTAVITQSCFWLVFKTNLNLRFNDPSLTLLQMATAIVWFSLMISQLPDIRGSLLLLYVMVMLFGIFQLDTLEFVCAGLLSLVCFGAVILFDVVRINSGMTIQAPALNISVMQWLILASAQAWIALFSSYVRRLSERLKKQKDVLKSSNQKMQHAHDALEQAMQQLDEVAGTDDLTGILNRRRFFEEAEQRLGDSERYCATALCMIDIDHFKSINDRFGHQAGDVVLERFCQIAANCLRTSDLFGRYGGEEFILLLPQTNQDSGVKVSERIRQAFAEYHFEQLAPGLHLSLSIGITLHRWSEPLEATIKRADEALYQAKRNGRNQTVYQSGAERLQGQMTPKSS